MHVVCNCREFWTMCNFHALLVFSRDFDMNWQPFLINLKTKKVVIIDVHTM